MKAGAGSGFRTYVAVATLFTAPALLGMAFLMGHGDGVVSSASGSSSSSWRS